jgi:carbonic anhydrase
LTILPSLKVFVIGCVDPRVAPSHVLGLELGEAATIRNIGGRVTSSVLDELVLLRR